MTITVLLHGESGSQEVPDYLLGALIAQDKVKAFPRSDGWAVIGQDPVRGPYSFPDNGNSLKPGRQQFRPGHPSVGDFADGGTGQRRLHDLLSHAG